MDDRSGSESADAKAEEVGYDVAAEARVRRKLDQNMIPLFFVLCECMNSLKPLIRPNLRIAFMICH